MCTHFRFKYPRLTIAKLAEASEDLDGDTPFKTDVFYNGEGPIVRLSGERRIVVDATWGIPCPRFHIGSAISGQAPDGQSSSMSGYWSKWLDLAHRCLVPVSSFAEPDLRSNDEAWFAFAAHEPRAFFAGIFLSCEQSAGKLDDLEVSKMTGGLFGVLAAPPNAEMETVGAEMTPIILAKSEEWHRWLSENLAECENLLRPTPSGTLKLIDHTPIGRSKCA